MTRIHPTAVVDPRAELAEDVTVGPHCVIEGPVQIGAGSRLMAHATVMGRTTLGVENTLYPGAVVGAPPQDLKYEGERVGLEIGDRNAIREHVTMHPGTERGGGLTRVGSDNLFMVGCHVAHDCEVGNHVVLSNHVLLAGHIRVEDGAIMNGASACHHYTTVGRLAYVGGLTRITWDVPPFSIVEGHPARVRAANVIGMRRGGFSEEDVRLLKRLIFDIYISDRTLAAEAAERAGAEHGANPHVAELLGAMQAAAAGRQGRAREPQRGA
jgi:UDP-N-acetylglucosamine acyltransferase